MVAAAAGGAAMTPPTAGVVKLPLLPNDAVVTGLYDSGTKTVVPALTVK